MAFEGPATRKLSLVTCYLHYEWDDYHVLGNVEGRRSPRRGAMIAYLPTPSPLVAYALDGLRHCWMPEVGRYSHRYRFDREAPNESVAPSEIFYTLNVLLGFSRLPEAAIRADIDAAAVFEDCCRAATTVPLRVYGYGMALWAGAALGIAPSGALADRVRTMLADDDVLPRQQVNQLCNKLLSKGLVIRAEGTCAGCGHRKIVNTLGSAPSLLPPAPGRREQTLERDGGWQPLCGGQSPPPSTAATPQPVPRCEPERA